MSHRPGCQYSCDTHEWTSYDSDSCFACDAEKQGIPVTSVRTEVIPKAEFARHHCANCNRTSVGFSCIYCGLVDTAASTKSDEGLRYNEGKPRFDLLPPEAMVELAAHYERGAKKYADRNWEKGMAWGKCFASLQRHAWAWMNGEDRDPETGTHHMISVAWNAIALFVYSVRKIGTDDRPKKSA